MRARERERKRERERERVSSHLCSALVLGYSRRVLGYTQQIYLLLTPGFATSEFSHC
jgi:hypothetical protein